MNFFSALISYQLFELAIDHGDGSFHYAQTIGSNSRDYPPIYRILAKFFTFDKKSFYTFNIFLFLIIFPLVFYWFCNRKTIAIYFFFILSNFSIYTIFNGFFPAGLAIMVFLIFLKLKQWYFRVPLFILAFFTHNFSFVLFLSVWIIEFMLSKAGLLAIIPGFYPDRIYLNFNERVFYWLNSNFLPSVLIGSIYWFFENKTYFLLILISFFYSFDLIRAFNIAQLLSLAGFVGFYEKQGYSIKFVILLICTVYAVSFQLWVLPKLFLI